MELLIHWLDILPSWHIFTQYGFSLKAAKVLLYVLVCAYGPTVQQQMFSLLYGW